MSKGFVGGLAVLMAAVATGALFLYVRNLRTEAETGPAQVDVIVSKDDIPAGTDLGPLVREGAFTTQEFDENAVVEGAITDLGDLEGETTSVPIVAGEQITSARLQGSEALSGGVLGIPSGREGVSLALEPQRVVARDLQRGDRVTLYATFDNGGDGEAVTVMLVSDVPVLKFARAEQGSQAAESLITVGLKPRDVQRLVYSQEEGTVWVGLLPPGQGPSRNGPVRFAEVLR